MSVMDATPPQPTPSTPPHPVLAIVPDSVSPLDRLTVKPPGTMIAIDESGYLRLVDELRMAYRLKDKQMLDELLLTLRKLAVSCRRDTPWAIAMIGLVLSTMPHIGQSASTQLQQMIVSLLKAAPERALDVWKCLVFGMADGYRAQGYANPEECAIDAVSLDHELEMLVDTPQDIIVEFARLGYVHLTLVVETPGGRGHISLRTDDGQAIMVRNSLAGLADGTKVALRITAIEVTKTATQGPKPGQSHIEPPKTNYTASMQAVVAPTIATIAAVASFTHTHVRS